MTNPEWDAKRPVVPFDGHGNMLHYPESWRNLEWKEQLPFRAALHLVDYQRGRSAAYFEWRADNGRTYPMFLKEFVAAVRLLELHEGATEVRQWRVVKRGQNYGIALDD